LASRPQASVSLSAAASPSAPFAAIVNFPIFKAAAHVIPLATWTSPTRLIAGQRVPEKQKALGKGKSPTRLALRLLICR
jgi:hypothetical protein